ncbi:MAG: cation diffusion facilitator family transporter [Spirochaetaceae bacterium]|jgi:cation diffusion facilitator family transporter|nr:cation diffusion facilitator family transporter [Spirochaetaceae bacterium]
MGSCLEKSVLIRRAALIAIGGNAVLAGSKIIAGVLADSMAVLADGIDSSVDVLIGVMQLVVSGIISRPADEQHPWGHGKAETVATAILSFILFYAGVSLVVKAGRAVLFAEAVETPDMPAVFVTLVSIAGKLLLAFNQYMLGKKAGSDMLKANGANMAGDVVISGGVLIGVGLAKLFNAGVLDAIAAGLVGLWVVKTALGIFVEINTELMDGGSSRAQYKSLFEAVRSIPGAGNPHRARIRKIAGLWDIDLDIEVDGKLSVCQAHEIATRVENAVRERLETVYDIMVHVEPAGDVNNEKNEGFGLSEATYEKV